jgi:hypothetical protein
MPKNRDSMDWTILGLGIIALILLGAIIYIMVT